MPEDPLSQPRAAFLVAAGSRLFAAAARLLDRLLAARPVEALAGSRTLMATVLATAVLLGMLLRSTLVGPVLGVGFLLLLGLVGARAWSRSDRVLGALLVLALGVRFVVLLVDHTFGWFHEPDADTYYYGAAGLAEALWTGTPWVNPDSPSVVAYEVAVAPFYVVFGNSPLVGRTVNAVLAMVAVGLAYGLARDLFGRRAGLAGAACLAFLPSLVLIQGEHFRDTLILVLALLAITGAFALRGGPAWRLLLLPAAFAGLYFLRLPTLLVVLAPVAVLLMAEVGALLRAHPVPRIPGRPVDLRLAFVAVLLLGGLAVVVLLEHGLPMSQLLSLEALNHAREGRDSGGSAYLSDVTFRSRSDVLSFLPVGAAYFLVSPFPWQVHNSLALVTALENLLVYYPLVALAVLGILRARPDGRAAALLAFLAVGAVLYGLLESNTGTAVRHRGQFTWVFFLFAGPMLARWLGPLRWPVRAPADVPARVLRSRHAR